jgi:polygalacturonase
MHKFNAIVTVLLLVATIIVASSESRADTAGTPSNSTSYNVRSFGAKGDGSTLDTQSINAAIDAATTAGGGTVQFPAGSYLTGSIHLKSNVALYLDSGATLVAMTQGNGATYDPAEPSDSTKFQDYGHSHFHNSLIWGEGLENVSILGPGEIYGKGLTRQDAPVTGPANKSICLKNCKNVILRDFTIRHGGWFGILATGVDNMTIDNLKIDTNRDGMDIDCCREVHVSNCTVNSPNDDGICLKSSYALNTARACENITITNCHVSGFTEGTLLDGTYVEGRGGTGRIKFGTESNGGFKNIAISNCTFTSCHGLALESADGAQLEDVSVDNLTMRDVRSAPIFIRLCKRMRGPDGVAIGDIKRVNISNIVVYNSDSRSAILITGIPDHPIEDISLSNIHVWYKGGGTQADSAIKTPEQEAEYPDPDRFGTLPAYGVFVRHAKGLTLENIQVSTLTDDQRSPVILDDVAGADLFRVKAQHQTGVPSIVMSKVTDLHIHSSYDIPDTDKATVDNASI